MISAIAPLASRAFRGNLCGRIREISRGHASCGSLHAKRHLGGVHEPELPKSSTPGFGKTTLNRVF